MCALVRILLHEVGFDFKYLIIERAAVKQLDNNFRGRDLL